MKFIFNPAKAGAVDNYFLCSVVLGVFFLVLLVSCVCMACVFVGVLIIIKNCSKISWLCSDKLILLS